MAVCGAVCGRNTAGAVSGSGRHPAAKRQDRALHDLRADVDFVPHGGRSGPQMASALAWVLRGGVLRHWGRRERVFPALGEPETRF